MKEVIFYILYAPDVPAQSSPTVIVNAIAVMRDFYLRQYGDFNPAAGEHTAKGVMTLLFALIDSRSWRLSALDSNLFLG